MLPNFDDGAEDECSTIEVSQLPAGQQWSEQCFGGEAADEPMRDGLPEEVLRQLELNELMELTNPECVLSMTTPSSPVAPTIDASQEILLCQSDATHSQFSPPPPPRGRRRLSNRSHDWSETLPDAERYSDGDWCEGPTDYVSLSPADRRWITLDPEMPPTPRSHTTRAPPREPHSSDDLIRRLARKVKRILIPHLRRRRDISRLTGAFVDNRLHDLIARKINQVVENTSMVESITTDDLVRRIMQDNEVSQELDLLCPIVAKIIFSSRQFRQLHVKIQRPTVRDHLERPESARLQTLLRASKLFRVKPKSTIRSFDEDRAVLGSPKKISCKLGTTSSLPMAFSDSSVTHSHDEPPCEPRNLQPVMKFFENRDQVAQGNPNKPPYCFVSPSPASKSAVFHGAADAYVENDPFSLFEDQNNPGELPLIDDFETYSPMETHQCVGSEVIYPLKFIDDQFFTDSGIAKIFSGQKTNETDREPPEIPTKRVLLELDRNVSSQRNG